MIEDPIEPKAHAGGIIPDDVMKEITYFPVHGDPNMVQVDTVYTNKFGLARAAVVLGYWDRSQGGGQSFYQPISVSALENGGTASEVFYIPVNHYLFGAKAFSFTYYDIDRVDSWGNPYFSAYDQNHHPYPIIVSLVEIRSIGGVWSIGYRANEDMFFNWDPDFADVSVASGTTDSQGSIQTNVTFLKQGHTYFEAYGISADYDDDKTFRLHTPQEFYLRKALGKANQYLQKGKNFEPVTIQADSDTYYSGFFDVTSLKGSLVGMPVNIAWKGDGLDIQYDVSNENNEVAVLDENDMITLTFHSDSEDTGGNLLAVGFLNDSDSQGIGAIYDERG